MIDPNVKRALGQMIKGVQIVATVHEGMTRAFTSHWVTQVAFEEPIVMASVSPKHDTYPLLAESGWFTVSVCAADQIDAAQYFSYPGHRFHHVASEMLAETDEGFPILDGCIAWVRAEVFQHMPMADHHLFFARVTHHGYGRLREPPLAYSARHGWRIAAERARPRGVSVRDRLLERLAAAGYDTSTSFRDDDEED